MWVVFILLMFSFAVQKVFLFDVVSHIFPFVILAWEIDMIKYCYEQCLTFCYLCYFSRYFMVSGVTFKSLIHFEFVLLSGVRRRFSFIFLHVFAQFSQYHLLNKPYIANCMCLLPLLSINWLSRCGFISGLSVLFCWCIPVFVSVLSCFDNYGLV